VTAAHAVGDAETGSIFRLIHASDRVFGRWPSLTARVSTLETVNKSALILKPQVPFRGVGFVSTVWRRASSGQQRKMCWLCVPHAAGVGSTLRMLSDQIFVKHTVFHDQQNGLLSTFQETDVPQRIAIDDNEIRAAIWRHDTQLARAIQQRGIHRGR